MIQSRTGSESGLSILNRTKKKFLFVGGTGRSGATLMHKILCRSSRVSGSAEFDHLRPMMELRRQMRSTSQLQRQSPYYDGQELDDAWRDFILRLVATRSGDSEFVAEKSPSNVDVIEDLLDLFPDAKFIAMVRDGRDVVASHLVIRETMRSQNPGIESVWLREFDPKEVCRTWKRNLREIERAQAGVGPDRLMLLRYEHLVEDPRTAIRDVCAFLSLDFEAAMLTPERLDADKSGHSTNIDGVWYDKTKFGQSINASSIGKWKQRLAFLERAISAIQIGEDLRRYGYELTPAERWMSAIGTARRRMKQRGKQNG